MASTLVQSFSHPNSFHQNHFCSSQYSKNPQILLIKKHQNPHKTTVPFSIRCTTSNSSSSQPDGTTKDSNPSFPSPFSTTLNNTEAFAIERRRKFQLLREKKQKKDLSKAAEPPNFEVGWRRSKEIKLEKPVGHVIMDFLDKLVGLMDREFGSKELLAKAGEIVAERAREEAEVLRDEGKVEERMVTELFRVLKLMEMDLAMVKAAIKDETLSERLQQAKARCRQAILVADSF